ncbi:MAG: hypothetical protein OSB62_01255 [Alphaproteobacteria bacterium]|nr:hypothetical protein [Alphaproteobacteria bacterium]
MSLHTEELLYQIKADASGLEAPLKQAENRMQAFSSRSGDSLKKGLLNSLEQGKFELKNFSDLLGDLAANFAGQALGGALPGDSSGIATAIGSSIGGIFGKAGGGTVSPNRPTLIGERGPEMFVPKVAGSVVPNHRLGSGSGGVTVQNHFNMSAGVAGTVKAELMAAIPAIEKRATAGVMNAVSRGGRAARAIGNQV